MITSMKSVIISTDNVAFKINSWSVLVKNSVPVVLSAIHFMPYHAEMLKSSSVRFLEVYFVDNVLFLSVVALLVSKSCNNLAVIR